MSRSSSFFGRTLLVPAAIVGMVALPGCGSKVTADNFAKVQTGQTEAEVQAILGDPTHTDAVTGPISSANKQWKDGDKTITVVFLGGKVVTAVKTGF